MRPHSYWAATDSALYAPLRDLLALTYGVEDQLRGAISSISEVNVALIHGSWAAGKARADSDIDVLLVGDADFDEALGALQSVGKRVGRRIDMTLFSPVELERMADSGFMAKILDGPTIPLKGTIASLLPHGRD